MKLTFREDIRKMVHDGHGKEEVPEYKQIEQNSDTIISTNHCCPSSHPGSLLISQTTGNSESHHLQVATATISKTATNSHPSNHAATVQGKEGQFVSTFSNGHRYSPFSLHSSHFSTGGGVSNHLNSSLAISCSAEYSSGMDNDDCHAVGEQMFDHLRAEAELSG